MIYEYFLSLGSNISDREENLTAAINLLCQTKGTKLIDISNIYETDPVGYTDQDKFLNMDASISSELEPRELLYNISQVENKLKRVRTIRFGPRTIDIDILLCKGITINSNDLTVPHERMFERAFVLVPLKEIYPYNDIDFEALIESCKDSGGVKLYKKINIADKIKNLLKTELIAKKIIYFNRIDSTNNYAKKIGKEELDGTVVIADCQTSGRGRLGRDWVSTDDKGLWMSLILKPEVSQENARLITLAAAVAVMNAIEEVTGVRTFVKWPNDVMLCGKKICGILTEAVFYNGKVDYIVLGIGININQQERDFPDSIKDIASSLKIWLNSYNDIKRECLAAWLFYELEIVYREFLAGNNREIIEKWKYRSATIGKEIVFSLGNKQYQGIAFDVNDRGELLVECEDKKVVTLNSGEILIKNERSSRNEK